MDLNKKANELKTNIPIIFIALKKKETPLLAKILAWVTIGYALSPIDLIPDFIPILGYLDDLIILPILVTITVKLIPNKIFIECQKESQLLWQDGKPKKWYYSIPIVVIWVLIVFWIIHMFI